MRIIPAENALCKLSFGKMILLSADFFQRLSEIA